VPQRQPERKSAKKPTIPDSSLEVRFGLEGTRVEEDGPRRKAFILMRFAPEYLELYDVVQKACFNAGFEPIRADEINRPGPVIGQIFETIGAADVIIAEVGSMSANVYYEIGLAHCVQKPSVLVANRDRIEELPFDIRHNRVIAFDPDDFASFARELEANLEYLRELAATGGAWGSLLIHLENLGGGRTSGESVLNGLIEQVGKEFELVNPRLQEQTRLRDGGFAVTIEDQFKDKVVFDVDVNGVIRRKKRLT
jgi:hypothetical protein